MSKPKLEGMTVNEVRTIFEPLADHILNKGLTLPQAIRAMELVVIGKALERHGRHQAIAANVLGIGPAKISNYLTRKKKPQKRVSWDKRFHGASPQQVFGGMEI